MSSLHQSFQPRFGEKPRSQAQKLKIFKKTPTGIHWKSKCGNLVSKYALEVLRLHYLI